MISMDFLFLREKIIALYMGNERHYHLSMAIFRPKGKGSMNGLDNTPVCAACSARKPGECCLRDLPDGALTRVRKLRGCPNLRSRLYSLGFVPGTEILVHGHGTAGCRIEVRDTCVVLDGESAGCILCDAPGPMGPHRSVA